MSLVGNVDCLIVENVFHKGDEFEEKIEVGYPFMCQASPGKFACKKIIKI